MNIPQRGPLPSLSEFTAMTAGPPQPARAVNSSREDIGRPVTFRDGQFKGRTLRAELVELQKADLGRKYARKDRRPLDPPPVVQLKLFDVKNPGMPFEETKEFDSYDDMGGFGILCHVDLFQVPPQHEGANTDEIPPNKRRRRSHSRRRPPSSSTPTSTSSTPTPSVSSPSYVYTSSVSPTSYMGQPTAGTSYPLTPPGSAMAGTSYPLTSPSAMASGSYPLTSPSSTSYLVSPYTVPPPPPPSGSGVTLPPISSLDPPPASGYQGSSHQMHSMSRTGYARHDLTLPPLPLGPPPPHPHYQYPAQPQAPVQGQQPPPPGQLHPAPQAPPTTAPGNDGRPIRAGPEAPDGVVAYLNGFEIREDSKCTDALAGASFAQSQSLEYHGRKVLMFVFSDIAVRNEGTFILRYRVFNIFGRAVDSTEIPILAECYGGPFRIYSTKEFPGLRPSTDLTKHLSYFGVRLNLRETERKRRRPGEMGSPPPSEVRRRRRRRRDDDSDYESSDDDY